MNKILISLLLLALAFSMMFGCTQTAPTNNTNNTTENTIPTNNTTNNEVATGTNDIPMPPALPE